MSIAFLNYKIKYYSCVINAKDIYGVWFTSNMPFIVESGGYILAGCVEEK